MNISGKTKVVGIFGYPVEHSLSPRMHNAAYKALGLDYCYVPFSVKKEGLESAVKSIRDLNMAGVNVTAPHKEGVIPYLDKLSPSASLLRAVNTIVNEQGTLVGHNTDAPGYVAGLQRELSDTKIKESQALILGGGGAARAVAAGLASAGIKKIIFSVRTPKKIEAWSNSINERFPHTIFGISFLEGEKFQKLLNESDILINALPIPLIDKAEKWLVDLSSITENTFFSDLRYAPHNNEFLSLGISKGCRTQDGLPMLLEQGIISFKLFTGINPPKNVMENAIKAS